MRFIHLRTIQHRLLTRHAPQRAIHDRRHHVQIAHQLCRIILVYRRLDMLAHLQKQLRLLQYAHAD